MVREDVCDDWSRPYPGLADALDDVRDCLSIGVPDALKRAAELLRPSPVASGATVARFRMLAEVAAIDLSLGRLFEGHCDAIDILRQAGTNARDGIYGVWAAATPLLAAVDSCDGATLSGNKPYGSGAPWLDRALVTAAHPDGDRLYEVDIAAGEGVAIRPESWPSTGMAASASFTLTFDRAPASRPVGGPGFYTSRPGFWQGSLNVAACWLGGAIGLARGILPLLDRRGDAHQWSTFGALTGEIGSMRSTLYEAAEATDRDPSDHAGRAHERALAVRHAVYQGATRAIELAVRIGGTGGFTHDPAQSRRLADLPIYLRQHHPGPDMETLGRMAHARFAHD